MSPNQPMVTELMQEGWVRKGRVQKLQELRGVGKRTNWWGINTRSLNLVPLEWRRLSNSPASHYESTKLELSGVGVPPSSSGPLSNDEGKTTPHFVSNGDKMLKSTGGDGSNQARFYEGFCC
jgi:hypothetical protein